MSGSSKRAVLFDLDGTLRHNQPSQIATFFSFANDLGLVSTPEQVRDVTRWIHGYWADSDALKKDRAERGDEWEKLWLAFATRQLAFLGVEADVATSMAEAIQARMIDEYRPEHVVPEAAPGLLDDLRSAGYRLGVVSNRRTALDDVIAELGLADRFDMTLAAGEVGWWKPDHRLLAYAADRLGVPPNESLYVGDNYFADVPAAQGAGMQAVLLDPEDLFPEADCQVIRELGELAGILALPERL
jgi:HAD superfamily hydrolase (TIGR01549 family)